MMCTNTANLMSLVILTHHALINTFTPIFPALMSSTMTFKVILEDQWTNKLVFATIEDCVDLEDCVNHIHSEFPSHTIDQITEVN